MPENVSFVDIKIDDEMRAAAVNVLNSGRLVKGPECGELEDSFADMHGTAHAVGVSNGTAALLLSMKAIGISEGDQVFVPGHTYFATVSPVLELGAEPIFVDVDSNRYTMAPKELQEAVTDADDPAAIAVTHMHGQPAEMDKILNIADEYGLKVIEDAAQAHGATFNGQPVGSFGDAGCFSFYPTKNMTVGGDGGMVTTDDSELAATVRALRNHGRDETGEHTHLGLNYRLDEVKAAIGRKQLEHLPDWSQARRDTATVYDRNLRSVESVTIPETYEDTTHVYHHYAVLVPNGERREFRAYLDDHGIGTGIHYDVAVHEHDAVQHRVGNHDVPVAEDICARTVSLPMHPRLHKEKIEYVCEKIERYFE
jgi:dTDP-4-amino-4,6-dideoxygalactose transaminase